MINFGYKEEKKPLLHYYLLLITSYRGGVAQLGAQGTQKRTLVKIEYYTHGALAQLG